MRATILNSIFKKEMREILRDKRMIFLVILMPFFLYPVLFTVMGLVGSNQRDRMASEKVKLLINPESKNTPVYAMLEQDTSLDIQVQEVSRDEVDTMRNTIGLIVPSDYQTKIDSGQTTEVIMYVDESKDLVSFRAQTISARLKVLNEQLLSQRLEGVGLDQSFIQPLKVDVQDLASKEQRIGKAISGFLPMMILLFIFIGCVYISIDITAGEKERRTLQTIFTTPITTKEIIGGKFLAVASVGIVSAAMNLLSLVFAMWISVKIIGESLGGFSLAISTSGWFWLALLVALSTLFIAAINLAVLLLANSYKEAQSYVTPLMMLFLLPSIIVQTPGWELTYQTAFIPILNIVLAMGEIIKGEPNLTLIGIVTIMALLYGLLALWIASKTFGNENVITGEKVDLKSLFR